MSVPFTGQVTVAAYDGGFLGIGQQQVSQAEVEVIKEIAEVLGTESPFV